MSDTLVSLPKCRSLQMFYVLLDFNFHDPTKWNLGSISQHKDMLDGINNFEVARCLHGIDAIHFMAVQPVLKLLKLKS